jgi:hypothetical protein|tara:strand:+ start:2693 stop:2854 length:162 start_codon:yes stop_codon:yes gene_type:complete
MPKYLVTEYGNSVTEWIVEADNAEDAQYEASLGTVKEIRFDDEHDSWETKEID